MKPKFYSVLDMCVENGLRLGYNRAFKHNENPDQDTILAKQHQSIFEELHEWFDFEENKFEE